MLRDIKINLQYQGLIPGPPPQEGDLFKRACSGDGQTVGHWKDTWVKNYQAAKDHFGSFDGKSFGQLFGVNRHKPAIVIGSGPSLRHSIADLKKNAESDHPVMTVSCLHNFGYFEDEGFHADYYLSLDSGGVVIDDVSEKRNKDGKFYWEKTKGKKLLAYIASDPRLWELWQGEVYLFNSLIPDKGVQDAFNGIERFAHYVSSGGNALGACMYTAKAVMGSDPIIYVGTDLCFDYDHKFHSYETQYDNFEGKGTGTTVHTVDVFGNSRITWPSYLNFKCWFDHIAGKVPGTWISCSEGILGAYRDGNIAQYKYMPLSEALKPYHHADEVLIEERQPNGTVSGRKPFKTAELFANPKHEMDLLLF